MDAASRRPESASGDPPTEARQRWRITFARRAPAARPHREIADDWVGRLVASGLPLARGTGRPRPALTFAAPLPVGIPAHRELADVTLAARLPVWDARRAIEASMPDGLELLAVEDVWTGAPPLASVVAAAEYRVELERPCPEADDLRAAARGLLESPALERERQRGNGSVRYDLRPLLGGIDVAGSEPPSLLVRTLFHVERGAGRPEEVLSALGDRLGAPLGVRSTTRLRVLLADEDGSAADGDGSERG